MEQHAELGKWRVRSKLIGDVHFQIIKTLRASAFADDERFQQFFDCRAAPRMMYMPPIIFWSARVSQVEIGDCHLFPNYSEHVPI